MSIYKEFRTELAAGKRSAAFPDQLQPDEYGLVYVGGELTVSTVLEAYTKGSFPWTGSRPIPWFSPDPRLLLYPKDFKPSKRLRRCFRQNRFHIRCDTAFRAVMRACAAIPRPGQPGTWITANMIDTYSRLHDLGIAHSIEVYDRENRLAGGLYGLCLGRVFFGESMFSRVPNTSKLALYALCNLLLEKDFHFIDCQQVTGHLMRLGAVPVRHNQYMETLRKGLDQDHLSGSWEGGVV